MKKKKGFTLIELIAVICISVILGALIISLFSSSNRMILRASKDNIMQDEARIIMNAIENDLRTAKPISIITDGVEFSKTASGATKTYKYIKVRNEIRKTEGSNVLSTPSKNVEEFRITSGGAGDHYNIYLKLKSGSEEYEFSSVVVPRNK
ncbi:type II secretion system protein [Clostridium baratii]|uniref:PilW family protein n=1 Tax=Clostridium baratii TaxID=1561 RepID=UPI0029101581|nr:type II secretion system protein [Clostridium baratii]MDU4911967.1 type II secretion system protein [Clostridium baratii]